MYELSEDWYRGYAEGILDIVKLRNPGFNNEQLANAYTEKLKDLGYSAEKCKYLRDFVFTDLKLVNQIVLKKY